METDMINGEKDFYLEKKSRRKADCWDTPPATVKQI
jgi:hypothetical protein